MTLIEVNEGKAKDVQITDQLWWNGSFHSITSILRAKCPCPCLTINVVVAENGKKPWVRETAWGVESGVIFKRPG
jgi:hypothetical protein